MQDFTGKKKRAVAGTKLKDTEGRTLANTERPVNEILNLWVFEQNNIKMSKFI